MVTTNSDPLRIPDGAPAWVDLDLLRLTIDTWQPYYGQEITAEVALGIVLRMARLVEGWRYS